MKPCIHEITPAAGYGATTGTHFCRRCGEAIYWDGIQYSLAKDNLPKEHLGRDIFWCCVIALALAVVSVLRHW